MPQLSENEKIRCFYLRFRLVKASQVRRLSENLRLELLKRQRKRQRKRKKKIFPLNPLYKK